MTGIGGSGPEPRDDLTKLAVNLTPPARAALEKASALTGDGLTDTVNRALLLYGEVADIAALHQGDYWVSYKDFDAHGGVSLLVTRTQRKRRWSLW